MELTPYQILWTGPCRIGPCGSDTLTTNDAFQSHLAHQPLYRAAGDIQTFTFELMPDLARSIDAEIIIPHSTDVIAQLFVFLAAHTGIFLSCPISVIGRWCNRQNPAD
ncbi:hypothetical protein BJI49_14075 [Acetobacter pasteurianus]|nr:hypothetical protein BJI49_14075 [Acetobacter pasteurianus]GCD51247.1 hypothetical protein NBRC106471_2803 [Acetobacter pasteurianus subsp. pasteurianus LMG 1262 = NBRC 106471]